MLKYTSIGLNLPPLDKHVSKGISCETHPLISGNRNSVFHFASVFTSSVHQRFCTVLFFFPPTLPPWVILCDVIGWQRGLLGISLAFAYCWFVFLINFTHNNYCFICVRRPS